MLLERGEEEIAKLKRDRARCGAFLGRLASTGRSSGAKEASKPNVTRCGLDILVCCVFVAAF